MVFELESTDIAFTRAGVSVGDVNFEVIDVFEAAATEIAYSVVVAVFGIDVPEKSAEVPEGTISTRGTRYVVFYQAEWFEAAFHGFVVTGLVVCYEMVY